MHRHRPAGWLRHYAGFLSPNATAALRVLTERDLDQRLQRLKDTVRDSSRERFGGGTRPRMRVLQARSGARLRWQSAPAPLPPGPDGAVVHPIASATCDVDCPLVLGRSQFALPLHLGHECVADVLTVGERVTSVKPGDRVIVPFEISCGTCVPCLAGLQGSCTTVPPVSAYGMGLATGHWGGAFSDEMAVPYADAMLVPLPDGIDPAAAASLADNVCDAYRHIGPHVPALLAADPDAEILILGALNERMLFSGSVQLYVGLIARACGARNLCMVDARPEIRAHAERLGLHAIAPRELRRRPPARLVVDLSVDKLGVALAHTAPDGICTSSGSFHRSAKIPALQMYVRNVTLHFGRTHARALIPEVLELMRDGRLRPETVTTTVGALDDAPEALREHFLGAGVKAVLTGV
jgi:alcohol dehydrogenase